MDRLYKIITLGILELFSIFGSYGCATRTKDLAGRINIAKGIEKPVISSLSKAGIASLIDSGLDKETQISVNQQFCRLMGITSRWILEEEINKFADYRFGNRNKRPSLYERNEAYLALFSVLRTVADFNGNQNGIPERGEIEEYYEKFGDKPFVQLLRDHVAY